MNLNRDKMLEVTHACGHTAMTLDKHRDFRIKRAAGTLCTRCVDDNAIKRAAMIAASITLSHETIANTALKGSTRQVEWAERIRIGWRDNIFNRLMLAPTSTSTSNSSSFKFAEFDRRVHPEEIERAATNVLVARLNAIGRALCKERAAEWIDQSKDQVLDSLVAQMIEEAELIERARLNHLISAVGG